MLSELQAATSALQIKLLPIQLRKIEHFDEALSAIMKERPDAFLMTNDPFHQLHVGRIIPFLIDKRLPGMFQTKENVAAGGLMSYGASFPDLFRRGAWYVHRILEGVRAADLPVEQPTKFEFVINVRTATAFGLDVPPTLLARADEVIE